MIDLRKNKKQIIEAIFFRPSWYSIFLNPYFISRRALYCQIRKFSRVVPHNSKILDVGCGNKPYKNLFLSSSYQGIDIEGGGHTDQEKTVDKFFDGVHIPFPDNQFEVILCTQVLEHTPEPAKLLNEMARTLKTDGQVFITTPFVWNEHEIPYDFYRFTRYGLEQLLTQNGLEISSLTQTTGIFGVLGQIFSAFVFESLAFRNTILKITLSIFILGPIQIISLFLDWLTNKRWLTLDYVIIATKQHEK
ncbi:MAG: class I SAM-dependent methyltransferase [Candidatus Paceibacterota bacterium]